MHSNYIKSSKKIHKLVENFRSAFVTQNREMAMSCFAPKNIFGMHMGGDLNEYIEKEMNEFYLKCSKFGLNEYGNINAYTLSDDKIYFYFGNDYDPALFEAIWSINKDNQLIGNQSFFRWEPKMQSIIKSSGEIKRMRVCNIKSRCGERIDWWVILNHEIENPMDSFSNLDEDFGGSFNSCIYEDYVPKGELNYSYWANWRIKAANGNKETQKVWMRGLDHPEISGDYFPDVDFNKNTVYANKHTKTIVILCVYFYDDSKVMIKYPKERAWNFEMPIKKVCLTDGLSYDWIVEGQH